MKVDTIVGIDIGTSRIRVIVTDLNGSILAEGHSAVEEQTLIGWKLSLEKAMPSNILSQRNNIMVSADGTSGTVIIVDEKGQGLCEPIMYYSRMPATNYEQNRNWHPRNLVNKMLWFGANSTLAKLRYRLSDMGKGTKDRISWILPQSVWLLYMLKFAEGTKWENIEIDPTNALKFGADVISGSLNWLTDVHEHFKIPKSLLPTIVPSGSFIGEAQSSFAEKIGLGKALLYQGMTDGNASALVAGTLNSDDFTIVAGSTSVMKTVVNSPKAIDEIYYQHHPLLPSKIFATSWIPSGKVIESITKDIIGCSIDEALHLAKQVSSVKSDSIDQYSTDFYLINNIQKIKEKLNSPRSYGHFVNSVLKEICMQEFHYISLFEKIFQRQFSRIRMIGGTTMSDYWCSMRASIFQKPIEVFRDLTPIGAVFPALLKERRVSSIDELKKRFCFVEKTFIPTGIQEAHFGI